ncbi:MAG: SDR family oxidoreductase [Elusimicrobia bacterium]|nr:SDR family oxidoreductase [Elusimicrobiota bacterium]
MTAPDAAEQATRRVFRPDLLAGKVAIVTGAGTGIGRVIARELAAHGADVVLAARQADRLEETALEVRALGRRALVQPTDVSEPEQAAALAEAAVASFGRIDLLVNNAAANFVRPSEMLTSVRWRKVIDIVLNGTFYCTLEAGKRMLRQGSGSIVSLVATYAWTGAPGLAPSASAKAGVVALTRSLGVEWADRGVRVNAIAPGFIDTPQSRERLWPTDEMARKIVARIPAGGFGDELDAANLVLYLASPAGRYITGEVIVADGGHCLGRGALEIVDRLAPVRKGRG